MEQGRDQAAAGFFDCFLSHNTRDKPAVRALAADLRARGLTVWLDEEQLRPGMPWQPLLESGIRASRSVAVLVGADGLGPWEQQEVHAALSLAVQDGRPVIPVLLPDAPAAPELPLFLHQRVWVDLRDPAGLDRLVWGITGCRPEGLTSGQAPTNPAATTRVQPPAPVDEASRRVSELRGALFLARSLDELKRLRNRVKALAEQYRSHPDVMDLADDVGQAIAVEQPHRQRASLQRVPLWMQGAALSIALLAFGAWIWTRLQPVPPGPEVVNHPTPEWIADWTGEIAGLGDPGAARIGLRIRIGAAQSALEVARPGRATCTAAVSLEVMDRHARLWTEGDIPCPDGTRLGALALSCQEAPGGAADCTGRYAIDRPIRVALARVGGGAWPVRPAPRPTPDPAVPMKGTGGGGQPSPDAAPGGPDTRGTLVQPVSAAPGSQPVVGAGAKPMRFSDPMKDGGQAPEMIALPAGCFQMGSPPHEAGRDDDEGPQHRVCLGAFAIGRTEVTMNQYREFVWATGRSFPRDAESFGGDWPVVGVEWRDAAAYAEWLSVQTRHEYRLPTEAEWEYAARAGTSGPFWTGDCIHTDQANYNGRDDYNNCGANTGLARAIPVPAGILPPNPWGLHEVAGNAPEWVQDCWHKDYVGAPTDGSAWLGTEGGHCSEHGVRGDGWYMPPNGLRSAKRDWRRDAYAFKRFPRLGFRLARTR